MSAAAGRADLNATVKIATVPANEPVFVLRAQDIVAADAVRAWAAFAHRAGSPVAVVEQALQQADVMAAWPNRRTPDAGHLGEAERKDLEHRFQRRAWRMRGDGEITRYQLAEERGFGAAWGRFRPMLAAAFAGLERQEDGSWIYRRPTGESGKPVTGEDPLEALQAFLQLPAWRPPSEDPEPVPLQYAPPAIAQADPSAPAKGQNDG